MDYWKKDLSCNKIPTGAVVTFCADMILLNQSLKELGKKYTLRGSGVRHI